MNLRMCTLCFVALTALALWPATALGGAWVQEKSSYYFKISSSYLFTETELNFDGQEVNILSGEDQLTNTSYRDIGAALYVEYGLTDRLTVVGALPFKVLRSRRTEVNDLIDLTRDIEVVNGGLSDLNVGLKYPLRMTPFPLSVYGAAKLPLGYDRRPENEGPPLGSGRVDLEGHLLAGVSLYPFPGYVTGGVGYRARTGDLDDEYLFSIEAGVSWGRLMGRIGLDGLYSTTDPPNLAELDARAVSSAVVVTNQDILKLAPGVTLSLTDEISLVAEAFHIIDGKNTVTGTTYAAGVVYQQ